MGLGPEILELVQPRPGPVLKFVDPVQPGPVPQKLTGYPIVVSPTCSGVKDLSKHLEEEKDTQILDGIGFGDVWDGTRERALT